MSKFSNYAETAIANWLRGSNLTGVPALYIAPFSTDPTDAGTGNELTSTLTGASLRATVSFAAPVDDAGAMKLTSNADAVLCTTAESAATITHFGIYDAATGGNLLVHGALTAPISVAIGEGARIYAGNLTISIS
jgi:hypothetical protein